MGFWDTMKGVGRAVGSALEGAVEIFGPPIAQAAAGALATRIAGGNNMGGGGYPVIRYQSPTAPRMPITPYTPMRQLGQMYSQQPATRMAPSSVPPSWTPLPQAPAMPRRPAWMPQSGYRTAGYQQASVIPDLLRYGGAYLMGEMDMPAFPSTETSPGTAGGGLLPELYERFSGLIGGQTTMFRYGDARVTPVREIQATNPKTGKIEVWKHMGRPLLYTGDLAACRRVSKISRRVARRRPR